MSSVYQKYLKDEEGNVFSPIAGLNTLVDDNLNNNINQVEWQKEISDSSELVFVGTISNVSSLSVQKFGYICPSSVYFDEYSGTYNSDYGYSVTYSGWYEITTRIEMPNINGSSSIETWLGYCIDRNPFDSRRGLWKMQQWRNECTQTGVEYLDCNQSIQFGYYLDGAATTTTISNAYMTIKRLRKGNAITEDGGFQIRNFGNSIVQGKYLKDEYNNVFSPITSAESCYYDSDNSIQDIMDRKTMLVACASYDTINFPTSVVDTNNVTYFSSVSRSSRMPDTNLAQRITKSESMPRVIVSKSGMYRIGVEARTADFTNGSQDGRVQVETISPSGISTVHLMCGDRVTYRYGTAGSVTLYLSRGTIVCPRIWKDYAFDSMPCMSMYVEYCGPYKDNLDNNVLSPWTKSECDTYMKNSINTYNKYRNSSVDRAMGYSFDIETGEYYKYSSWIGHSGDTNYYFYKNGGLKIVKP